MAIIPRTIEKFLDLANLQKHNNNYDDIAGELESLAGAGRTTESIKGNADSIAALTGNTYTKAQIDGKDTAVGAAAQTALDTHKSSADHDARYNTKTQLQTSGQSTIHWDNLTNKPNFADARWKAPVSDKATLDTMISGNSDGDVRLVLSDETVYEWDLSIGTTNKWRAIGAIGNGLTSHSALTDLSNDDHIIYLTDSRGDIRYYLKSQVDAALAGKVSQGGTLTSDLDFAQYQAINLIIHKATSAPSSPVEGQPWYDTTNHALMIYKGTGGWVDVSGRGAVIRDQLFTALAGQTVFDITIGQYIPGTNAISVFKLYTTTGKFELVPESEYTETNSTRFTLLSAASAGEQYYIKFFENTPEIIAQTVQKDGTLQVNLNSEMLNGKHDTDFAPISHVSITTGVHGSTPAPTASKIIERDASGRAQVAAPSAAADIARKDTVDAVQTNFDTAVTASPAATALNLGYGQQVINATRTAPYNVLSITGRTLINLLGRDGNCDSLTKINAINGTSSIDTTTYKYGSSAFKAVSNTTANTSVGLSTTYPISNAKYYLAVFEVKNIDITQGITVYLTNGSNGSVLKAGTTTLTLGDWSLGYVKISPSDIGSETTTGFFLQANNTTPIAGKTYYVDGLRLHELSAAEYTAIDSMTAAQIAAKYPYVDDMKQLQNPYVIKKGENLLPPFSEWTKHANTTINASYNFTHVATTNVSEPTYFYVPVVSGQTYTLSKSGNAGFIIAPLESLSNQVLVGNRFIIKVNDVNSITLTIPSGASVLAIYETSIQSYTDITNPTTYIYSTGTFTLTNPMLNLGATALTFTPNHDQYLAFQTQLASSVDGSVVDQITRRGEEYWLNKRFKMMDLTGDLSWIFGGDGSSWKFVKLSLGTSNVKDTGHITKFDGRIIPRISQGMSFTQADQQVLTDATDGTPNGIIITIADTDSGWGDAYTPSAAETQAYFYGWKMSSTNTASPAPYNGTGSKYWYQVGSAPLNSAYYTSADATPTTAITAVTPYKLQYQLATPIEEQIVPEGDIALHEGLNQIEVGNGIIVRERANPLLGAGLYKINSIDVPSPLKYANERIINIYKNGQLDTGNWTIVNGSAVMGKQRAYTANFDPSATYTVTYIAEQYSLTSNVQAIAGEYPSNLKTTVDTLAKTQADIATAVSVLQSVKASKVQPQWIAPTLLNGWVNFGGIYETAGYLKDAMGGVTLKGLIKSGTLNNPSFILPVGYRPTLLQHFIVNGGDAIATITIAVDGQVSVAVGSSASSAFTSLTGIRFLVN